MLIESIHLFVQTNYGDECWTRVLHRANLRHSVFAVHLRYSDSVMTDLAQSCSAVIGDGSQEDFMLRFGRCFVDYFNRYGYGLIMRASGRYYRDFLNGIDNLHETMRFSYPRMSSPSFYVSAEDQYGCLLHYKSRRTGFTQYVVGQLVQCAMTFYGVELAVKVVEERKSDEGCHVVFRLDFDNSAFISLERSRHNSGLIGTYGHTSARTFFKVGSSYW